MVERTKKRPIASGAISGTQALVFLGAQLVLGYLLLLPVNELRPSIMGFFPPTDLYVPAHEKNNILVPQAHLGLTANWGALYSWAAIKGSVDPGITIPLLIGCFFWTLEVDTIYAHQDKEDDVKVGVKSTALLLGDSTKFWTTIFGITSVASFVLSGFNANIGSARLGSFNYSSDQSSSLNEPSRAELTSSSFILTTLLPFYALMIPAAAQIAWQIWAVDLKSPADCGRKFRSNKYFGAIVFLAILLGKAV
ncbi:Palmitoyl-protein thioesterase 1 [Orobanche minor]